jgi:hypothetical protein
MAIAHDDDTGIRPHANPVGRAHPTASLGDHRGAVVRVGVDVTVDPDAGVAPGANRRAARGEHLGMSGRVYDARHGVHDGVARDHEQATSGDQRDLAGGQRRLEL